MITNNVTTGVHLDSAATDPDGGLVKGLDTVRAIREANPARSHTKKVARNLVSLSCFSFLF